MRQQKAERDVCQAAHAGEVWDQADFERIRRALLMCPCRRSWQRRISRGALVRWGLIGWLVILGIGRLELNWPS